MQYTTDFAGGGNIIFLIILVQKNVCFYCTVFLFLYLSNEIGVQLLLHCFNVGQVSGIYFAKHHGRVFVHVIFILIYYL